MKIQSTGFLVKALPFIIGFFLGFWFITLNITSHSLMFFPGDLGDARLMNYFLEHDFRFFTGQEHSFWNAPFMVPEPNVITISDNLAGTAPIYSLFRIFGANRETAFQLWYIGMTLLNYACCYWFLVKTTGNRYSAALGAMVFAFSIALQSQLTHSQTFPRFPIPLTFLALTLFTQEFKSRYFFLALLLVVYQLYCGIYIGFMLCIPVTIFILIYFIYKRSIFLKKIKDARWLLNMTLSLVVKILLALPLMLPYYERSKTLAYVGYDTVLPSIPTVKSFLYSKSGSIFWKFLERVGENSPLPWDQQLFPGGIALLCMIISAIAILKFALKKREAPVDTKPPIFFFLITAFLTFILFVRVNDFSLYKYVSYLPGFGMMRVINRIIDIHLLYLSIAVAYVFAIILKSYSKFNLTIFLAGAILLIADNYVTANASYKCLKQVSQERVDRLEEKMRLIPKGSIISCETNIAQHDVVFCQVDAMLAAQSLGLRSINGYSSYSPQGYGDFWLNMNAAARKKWIAFKNLNPDSVYVVNY